MLGQIQSYIILALVAAIGIAFVVGNRRGYLRGYKEGVTLAAQACRDSGGQIDIIPDKRKRRFPKIFGDRPAVVPVSQSQPQEGEKVDEIPITVTDVGDDEPEPGGVPDTTADDPTNPDGS